MRLVRERSFSDEIETEQKLKKDAREKAALIENGDADKKQVFGVRELKELKDHLFPTIEV